MNFESLHKCFSNFHCSYSKKTRRVSTFQAQAIRVLLVLVMPVFSARLSFAEDFKPIYFGLSKDKLAKSYEVHQIASSVAGNVLYDNDKATLTLQFSNLSSEVLRATGTLLTYRYQVTTGRDVFGTDLVPYNVALVGRVPITVSLAPKGFQNIEVTPTIPAQYAGYRLVVDFPGQGRRLAADLIRSVDPRPNTSKRPLSQFPVMTLDPRDPAYLERVGIRNIRKEINYIPTTDPGYAAYMASLGEQLAELQKHNVTCSLMQQSNSPSYVYPLGSWIRRLNDKGEEIPGGFFDTMWLPKFDEDYQKFVAEITKRYGWPKGPVVAWSLYNEPWEGGGIAGWMSDIPRYQEAYTAMAKGVQEARRDAGVHVLVGGADSSSNAMDKFFADGTDKFLPIFDFVSIHYQGLDPKATFALWRNRKGPNGRVKIWDTESWVASTPDRMSSMLPAWRAVGYDRIMGIYANVTTRQDQFYRRDASEKTQWMSVDQPLAASVGVAALSRFMGDRPFRELLFKNGLPYVFVFDGLPTRTGKADPEDCTVIVTADIGAGSSTRFWRVSSLASRATKARLERQLASLPTDAATAVREDLQYRIDTTPSITQVRFVLAADPSYALYDCYGNRVAATGRQLIVPLNTSGYYLRGNGSPGSFAKLMGALKSGVTQGYDAVDITALDMTTPLATHPTVRLVVTNVQNQKVSGALTVKIANLSLDKTRLQMSLRPHETRVVSLRVIKGKESQTNLYPLTATFDAGRMGQVTHKESLHCNVISRKTIKVDGNLSDWTGVLPQTVRSAQNGPTLTETAWYPNKNFAVSEKNGITTAYLAYDSEKFYFAAKIADSTPDAGMLRFETRDDDAFFYPQTSYQVEPAKENQPAVRVAREWPAGVRRFVYRKDVKIPAGNGQGEADNVQIAFNVVPPEDVLHKGFYPFMPGTARGFAPAKTTDYEYALNSVAPQYGGGTEIWRLLVPGMPPKHFYPRQPRSPFDGPVKGGQLVTKHTGNTRIVECSFPWSELRWVKHCLDHHKAIKFSFRVNDNDGPQYELAQNRSVSTTGGSSFRADWTNHWANELEFGFD